jgi:hypothetical protein
MLVLTGCSVEGASTCQNQYQISMTAEKHRAKQLSALL